jgi:hypothetical protein
VNSIRSALIIVATAVLPTAANAGLIQYGWQVTGSVYANSNSPSPGQLSVGLTGGTALSSDPNYYTVLSSVTMSGWATATPSPSGYSSALFNVVVNLTDLTSGQSGTMAFHGVAWTNWAKQIDGDLALTGAGIEAATSGATSLILGTNRYIVTMGYVSAYPYEIANPSQAVPLNLNVQMSLTPVEAPEPGSIVLFAVGLSFSGFLFRARRRSRGLNFNVQ